MVSTESYRQGVMFWLQECVSVDASGTAVYVVWTRTNQTAATWRHQRCLCSSDWLFHAGENTCWLHCRWRHSHYRPPIGTCQHLFQWYQCWRLSVYRLATVHTWQMADGWHSSPATVKSKSTVLKSKSKSTLIGQVQVRVQVLFKKAKSKYRRMKRTCKHFYPIWVLFLLLLLIKRLS